MSGKRGQCWADIMFPIGKGYLRTCGEDLHVYFMVLNNWPERNTNIISYLQMESDAPSKAYDNF